MSWVTARMTEKLESSRTVSALLRKAMKVVRWLHAQLIWEAVAETTLQPVVSAFCVV